MKLKFVAGIIAVLIAVVPVTSNALTPIGKLTTVKLYAYGTPPQGRYRAIFERDQVVRDEVLETIEGAALAVEFLDGTTLTLGSSSKITLADYVYTPEAANQRALYRLGVGAFFFVSGNMANAGVAVVTPTATIGIRGTAFGVIVGGDGSTTVGVAEGEVFVTSTATGDSQTITEGNNISVDADGRLGVVAPGAAVTGDAVVDQAIASHSAKVRGRGRGRGRGQGRGRGRGRGGREDKEDRSGPGDGGNRGHGSGDDDDDDDDDDDGGNSGSGGGDDDDDDSGNSGSGSGGGGGGDDDSGNSGSGSGGDDGDDSGNSGSGSGGDDGDDSGNSGSGGGGDDGDDSGNSGSGSGGSN